MIDLNKLKPVIVEKEKTAFYCSDFGKLNIDLYFSLTNEPQTNKRRWHDSIRLGAGKGAEEELLKVLKFNGITAEDYSQDENGRVDFNREGIEIHGYIDAISNGDRAEKFGFKKDCPIEIKTINNANKSDIKRYENNLPRDNYVGQLAIYMDFLGKETGYLFVGSLDGLNTFCFECIKIMDGVYKCGNTTVSIIDEYKRWSDIAKNVSERQMPECDVRYKIPIDEIDWKNIKKDDIRKARTGAKVIGDVDSWKITYSPWKNKIIEIQGVTLGYNEEELKVITELTTGYTTWK